MKKTVLFTSFFILIVTTVIVTFICFIVEPQNPPQKSPQMKTENAESKVSDIAPATDKKYVSGASITGYLMKSENTEIEIYEMYDNGNTQLIDSLNINPETLPDADKKDLLKGIVLTSYEKMLGLIEDYSS